MSLRRRRDPQYLELTTNKNGTFAASITRVAGAPACIWKFEDGEEQIGDSCSKVLDGHEQKVVCKIVPKFIATIAANTQSICRNVDLRKAISLTAIYFYDLLGVSIEVPNAIQYITVSGALPGCISLSSLNALYIEIYAAASGSLSDLAAKTQVVYINGPRVSKGTVSQCTGLYVLYIPSSNFSSADVNYVIQDIWQHRADFTYAGGITCNLDGNNAAPSGNVIPPEEGTDWHLDGETWIPLTAGAMVFDVVNDVNSEGFNFWNITVT